MKPKSPRYGYICHAGAFSIVDIRVKETKALWEIAYSGKRWGHYFYMRR
jgi:hypothetical protein